MDAGGDRVDSGLGVDDSVVFAHPGYPAMGCLRRKLRTAVWLEHGFGGVLAFGHQLDRMAAGAAVAPKKIWQPFVDQIGVYLCAGRHIARPADIRGFLPVCHPFDRSLV